MSSKDVDDKEKKKNDSTMYTRQRCIGNRLKLTRRKTTELSFETVMFERKVATTTTSQGRA